jgi:hypothetical protein
MNIPTGNDYVNRLWAHNSSGFLGVDQCAASGRWRARIAVASKVIYLGEFDTKEEAGLARKLAEVRYKVKAEKTDQPLGLIVDQVDIDLLKWSWKDNGNGYMVRSGGSGKSFRLHRLVMGRMLGRELNLNEFVDHVNFNPLDNRRGNLRVVTKSQNMTHRSKLPSNNTSGYRGVSWYKRSGKWEAYITKCNRRRRLGLFDTKEEAHLAYVAAAERLFGKEYMGIVK